jgi:hypothetical protein
MFNRSDMDYGMAEVTSERVYENKSKFPSGDPLARNIFNGPKIGWLM